MWSQSNFYSIFFLLGLSFGIFPSSSADGDPCQNILVVKETILWIGLFRTRMVLMTDADNVYDMSVSALDHSSHHLYLSGVQTRKEIYPKLDEKIRSDGTGFFKGTIKRLAVEDEAGEYLYVETTDRAKGNVYDIKNQETHDYKIKDLLLDPDEVAISSPDALSYYVIENSKSKRATIRKGTFLGGKQLYESSNVQSSSEPFYFCKKNENEDKIFLSKTKGDCTNYYVWGTISQGFSDQYNFYFFESLNRTVFVFAISAFTNPQTEVKLIEVKYDDFFICHAPSSTGLIVGIIIGVIILVALVIIICCYCKKKRAGKNGAMPVMMMQTTSAGSSKKKKDSAGNKKDKSHSRTRNDSKNSSKKNSSSQHKKKKTSRK